MKLNADQRATIVENDPVAVDRLRQLYQAAKTGQVTPKKVARLTLNIEGWAIQRWRDRIKREGIPVYVATHRLACLQ